MIANIRLQRNGRTSGRKRKEVKIKAAEFADLNLGKIWNWNWRSMALKFLNKKGWHTGSLRNIENVWKAEQKHDAEQKKLEELRKQILEERERSEYRLLQEQAGLVPYVTLAVFCHTFFILGLGFLIQYLGFAEFFNWIIIFWC